jgi:hypothetical protein
MKAIAIMMSALGWLMSLSPGAVQAGVPDLPRVLADDNAVSRLRELDPYVKSLRPEEVPAALKQAIAGHGPGRENAIDALSGRWAELDAPAALAFARQTSDREAGQSIEDAYYGSWADRDPDGALKAANQADDGERANAIWQIAHKIGPHDPQRAHDLIDSVHTSKMEDSDYFIFWIWAERNLGQANQELLQEAKFAGYSYPCETAVWAITDRLSDNDPKAAANWAAQLPAGKVHDEAFERLESNWAKVNRDGVAAWLKSLPDSDQVRNAVLNLPQKNAVDTPLHVEADPSFAAKAGQLNNILWDSNFWLELEALLPFVDGLSSTEFPQALEHLCNTPDSNRDAVTDVLIERWSKVDPAGMIKAIPAAATMHDSEFSERFLTDVYAAWSQRDPEAAFAAATRDDHGVGDYDVLRVIFAALARQDPAKAYVAFRKLDDANSHLLVIPIFTEWAARDLPAATKALSNEPHSDGAIEGIVIGLMRSGPSAAIKWAENLPTKSDRDRALRDVALRWPDDPEAAAAWLEKSPAFDGKNEAFDDVAVDWAVRDSMQALHYAVGLPDGKEKDVLLEWGLAQLTYDDAEAAQRFARQLSGDEMKKHALATVLAYWSEYDPATAAKFLVSIATEATPSDVADIAASLSDGDPVSAVHWLDALPASVDKAPAIGKIAENWYRTDPSAAERWVNHMPPGPLYDAGARGICAALNGDLDPALKWARSIRDAKIRQDTVYHAFDAATCFPLRFGIFSDSGGIKEEIQGATELTDADKKALITRLPTLVINREPWPLKKPQVPPNH